MASPSWRDHAAPIIRRILKDTEGQSEQQIRKALREAYPFGERSMHPYKVWCDEVRRQRGLKRALRHGGVDPARAVADMEAAGQTTLFMEDA